MKKLIILLFIVASFSAKAQLADTTTFLIGGASNTGWIKSTGFLPWQSNDSLTGKIEDGNYYVRAFFNSVVFTTQEAGIYANAGDQTARINYVLSKSFVKGLRISQNTGDSVIATGTINGQNKVIYSDGSLKIGGGGTLTNVEVSAPSTAKIFTPSMNAGTGFSSTSGEVSVMWWGADNTNVADATIPIQKAFNIPINNTLIVFPPGAGYKTTDSVVLNPLLSLKMAAPIVATDTTKPALIIGHYNSSVLSTYRGKQYTVWVQSATLSTWTDTNHVGILFRNINFSQIYPIQVSRFTYGMKYFGADAGTAYNNTYGGYVEDCAIGVFLGVSGSGYVNQNNWWGTNVRVNSGTNTSKVRYGVQIGNTNYDNNNNRFYNNSFELGTSALATLMYVYGGSYNGMYNARDEGNGATTISVRNNTGSNLSNVSNEFTIGYGGASIADSSGSGLSRYVTSYQTITQFANYTTVTGMDNVTEKVSYYKSDSTLSIAPPAYFAPSSGTAFVGGVPSSTGKTGLLKKGDYLQVGIGSAVVLEDIDVSRVKRFVLFRDVVSGYAGRIRVQYFDANYRNISNTKRIQSYAALTYDASFGGSWVNGTDYDGFINISLPDEAKYMRLMLTSGTEVLRLKSYKLISLQEGAASTTSYLKSKTQTLTTAQSAPTIGSYTQSRVILNDMTLDTTVYAWECYQPGTFGTLVGITGSIASGSNQLILNSGGGASVEKGYILQIGSLRLQIIGTSGDTCWLSANADGTLSGAAISFAEPKFCSIYADGSGDVLSATGSDLKVAYAGGLIDSTKTGYLTDRRINGFKQNSVAPYLIDGTRSFIIGVDTFLVNGNGDFYASSLGIYDDANAATMLNAAFDKDYVQSIIMSYDTPKVVYLTDDISAHGKTIKFGNGVRFGQTYNIDSLRFSAGDYAHVFGDSMTFTNLTSQSGHATPQNFGAVGDGVADDTRAIQALFNVPNITAYFPPGIYKTTDSLTLHYTKSLAMSPNALIMSYTTDRPAIIIGSYDDGNQLALRGKEYEIYVQRGTQSDWSDTNSVGVKVVNTNYSPRIAILKSNNFTIGALTLGYNSGLAYCDYELGVFQNNKIGLKIATSELSGLAWNNQNNYKSGWFRKNNSVNPGQQVIGVWMGSGNYFVTNNFFDGASFEGFGSNGIAFYLQSASRNQGINFRSEGLSDTVVYIAPSASSNKNNNFYAGRDGGTGFMVDSSATKTNQYTSAERISYEKSNYTVMSELDNIVERCVYVGTDSINIAYPGLFMDRTGTNFPTNTTTAKILNGQLLIDASYLYALSTNIIDVSIAKSLVIKQFSNVGYEARIIISLFDANMKNISATGLMGSLYTQTYSSTYGGSVILLSTDTQTPIHVRFNTEVKYVRILFARDTHDVRISGYKIVSYDQGASGTKSLTNDRTRYENIARAIPTVGNYKKGKIIYNSSPNNDSARGWICSASGTFGTNPATTITMANNQIYAVLGSGGGLLVQTGQWLNLNGYPTQIIGVSADTVWLGDRTYGTLSGAALTYATPSFINLSGSGNGDVTYSEVLAAIDSALSAQPFTYIQNLAPSLTDSIFTKVNDSTVGAKPIDASPGVTTATDSSIILNITPGTWTPTVADSTNVSTSTPHLMSYTRVGDIVWFGGAINVTASGTGATEVQITLPPGFPSNFGQVYQASGGGGVAGSETRVLVQSTPTGTGYIVLSWTAADGSAHEVSFSGQYQIIP